MKALAVFLFMALLAACAQAQETPAPALDRQAFGEIERGRYLVIAGDCQPCHTAPGGAPFAGGRNLETPFGNLVSPNITPDTLTGIGSWTEQDFYRALHDGIGRGGNHLYPAFPYTAFTRVTREDVDAIRDYLATLPAVNNRVHSNTLPFPFDIRASLIGWDKLFFDKGTYQPNPQKNAQWNRGAYLVEGLGHCGTCHTPKNALGGDENGHFVQGNVLQGWYAPNLTADGWNGLGSWTVDDVVAYLHDGANSRQLAAGPMAEVIQYSTSQMTMDDLRAIAVYLKDLPAPSHAKPAPAAATDQQMHIGEAIYTDQCAACHTLTGQGAAKLFPDLRNSASVQSDKPATLIRVVLQGAQTVATPRAPTAPQMPAFGWKLDDAQVAAVLTYIRNAWGNAAAPVSASDVSGERQNLSSRPE